MTTPSPETLREWMHDPRPMEELYYELIERIEGQEEGFEKAESPWVRHEGPRGGKGWRNTQTDEIRYQQERPGAQGRPVEKLRDMGVENFENLDDLHPSFVKGIANGLAKAKELVPVLPMPRTIIYDPDMGSLASVQGNTLRVSFDPRTETAEEFNREYAEGDVAVPDVVSPTVEGAIIHEAGHMLENLLMDVDGFRYRLEDLHGQEVYTAEGSAMHRIFGKPVSSRDRVEGRLITQEGVERGKGLSIYAQTSASEHFAEAWTAYVTGEAEVSPEVEEFFDKVVALAQSGTLLEHAWEVFE